MALIQVFADSLLNLTFQFFNRKKFTLHIEFFLLVLVFLCISEPSRSSQLQIL